jgi:O-antigen ligase
VDKINFPDQKLLSKTNIAILCSLAMVLGFLVSRSVMSIAMMVMGVYSLLGIHPRRWFESKWWVLGLVWVGAYALSYFWSDGTHQWAERFQAKFPLLILPIAFTFLPKFSIRQLQVFCIGTGIILLGGAAYSISFLIGEMEKYYYSYGSAGMLPVPSGDYIRFSLMIALYVIWCFYIWPQFKSKPMRWFIGIVVALLVCYLHVLAARSGLVALYIFLTGWAAYAGLKRSKWFGVGAVLILFTGLLIAGNYVPTLKQRIGYFKYTVIQFREGHLTGIYSDMGRLMSYNVALQEIGKDPVKGVGAGDLYTVMENGYHRLYPGDNDGRVLVPHNQFLAVALCCGIPAMLIFIWWAFAPLALVKKNREGFFFFIIWLICILQLMIEPALEVQLGIFVYLFFLLFQRHMLVHAATERIETV